MKFEFEKVSFNTHCSYLTVDKNNITIILTLDDVDVDFTTTKTFDEILNIKKVYGDSEYVSVVFDFKKRRKIVSATAYVKLSEEDKLDESLKYILENSSLQTVSTSGEKPQKTSQTVSISGETPQKPSTSAIKEVNNKTPIYSFEGYNDRKIDVYNDRIVITVIARWNTILTGRANEKTIYYSDCIKVEFDNNKSFHGGYLRLVTADSNSFIREKDKRYDDNSISFPSPSKRMDEIANFIKNRVKETKEASCALPNPNISATDEIIKYKNLLDIGAITQEEYDLKKKQLLGL